MQSFLYPAELIPENSGIGFTVRFKDLPEAITSGKNRADALNQASDCLAEALAARIDDRRDIPPPSTAPRRYVLVSVPAPMAAKAALYLTIRDLGLSNSEVARKLGVDEKEIRRMLDPRHTTKLARMQELLALLGKRIVISLCEA
jgi:antitoxin HicB